MPTYRIAITPDILVKDLEMMFRHSEEVAIDGDRSCILLTNPDRWLLEELENRGLKVERV